MQLVFDLLASLHGLDLALENLTVVIDEQFAVLQMRFALLYSLSYVVNALNRDLLIDFIRELKKLLSWLTLSSLHYLQLDVLMILPALSTLYLFARFVLG